MRAELPRGEQGGSRVASRAAADSGAELQSRGKQCGSRQDRRAAAEMLAESERQAGR